MGGIGNQRVKGPTGGLWEGLQKEERAYTLDVGKNVPVELESE